MDNPPDLLDWESASEDGSNCEDGDRYIDVNCSSKIDDAYEPLFMEKDGSYDIHFDWQYELSDSNKPSPSHNMHNGLGPCLKQGIGKSFNTEMQCVGKCDGMDMDMEFFHCINANDTNALVAQNW